MDTGLEKDMVMPEEVIRELARIGFAKATDFLTVEGGTLMIRSTGELSEDAVAAIAAVERTSAGIKVKFYDKLKALELLGKQFGLFDGKQSRQGPNNHLLDAILAGTKEDVDIFDIPEAEQAAVSCHDLVEQAEPV